MDNLTRREAARIALAAQGFNRARRPGEKKRRHLDDTVGRTGLLQIDSVNVLMRAHYLPLFSRLGAYDPALLDSAAWGKRRTLFEYWGHEASLMPLALQPYMRWRMARAERTEGIYQGIGRLARERPDFVEAVYREVADRGPVAAGDIDRANHKGSSWWGWTDTKIALEYLFWAGRITTATRRGFERLYDLTERVIPAAVQAVPTPSEADAQRHLVAFAARALGVATESDLRDYFRLDVADARARIAELVEAKALVPVAVEGWRQAAYLDPGAAIPRRVAPRALVSPFDPLVWERGRAERLFDFRYRLEIYTPAHKREYGYYVLPFLLGEKLAARVDLKAERKARVLRVAAAHLESRADPERTAAALAEELKAMAGWLGLDRVAVDPKGDLAPALTAYV
jgi:uncharacterized protein YcaQ